MRYTSAARGVLVVLTLAILGLTLATAVVQTGRQEAEPAPVDLAGSVGAKVGPALGAKPVEASAAAPVSRTAAGAIIEAAETVAADEAEAAETTAKAEAADRDPAAISAKIDDEDAFPPLTPIVIDGIADSLGFAAAAGLGFTPEIGQNLIPEVEPNNTAATATPLGTDAVGIGNLPPVGGDIDFWSFPASAGDRVYAAVMTSWSANASTDSHLDVIASDGTTSLEFDDDDGHFGSLSSSIAGTVIPSDGTYYLRVKHNSSTTGQLRPYHVHLTVQSGAPVPEEEPNDNSGIANPLPAGGWVSGTRDPAAAGEQDWYSFSANAGDTVFLSVDFDPERDQLPGAGGWDGALGIGLFGDAGNFFLIATDTNTGSSAANPASEALFMTVRQTGTYYAVVYSLSATIGSPLHTYNLSVRIRPATAIGVNCTTYTSTDVPQTLPTGTGPLVVNSTIVVPGSPRIADVDVSITLTHALMADLDVMLISPGGNEVGLFTDIGATATGGQNLMETVFDDQAGIPPLYTVLRGVQYQPELVYRLGWFNGMNGGGTWTLRIRDDIPASNGGTLTAWSLTICERPPAPSCGAGAITVTKLATDFEANDGGFTTAGAAPAPWQHGTPTAPAHLNTCNSGTKCWKTNLAGNYSASANQDLISPDLDLTGLEGPIRVEWAQKYQLETATNDRFFLEVREVGGANPRRLFEFLDATMSETVGSPSTTVHYTAGWGQHAADISAYADKEVQLRFNFLSSTSIHLAGLAIDDVSVTACCSAASCDDGDPCTIDTCDPVAGCIRANICDDNNACTIDTCNPEGGGCTNTPIVCDDGNACTDDTCDPGSGCVFTNNTAPCDDGNLCTSNDACGGGSCQPGTPNNEPCEDGNPCTVNDACGGGSCQSGPLGCPTTQICNTDAITIPSSGAATPYPSTIAVAGLGFVGRVTVDLNDINHTFPDDIDVLLVGPAGQNATIMSDVGGSPDAIGVNLRLDDTAASALPDSGPLVSGTFRPTNIGAVDTFPAPAPAPLGGAALSIFTGTNPDGTWSLYVNDDASGDSGSIAQGWCLNIAAPCTSDVQCDDGNVCTDDSCNVGTGLCTFTPNTAACDDGNLCTLDDQCSGGACSGTPVDCNDSDFCTIDSCDTGSGDCVYTPVNCDDLNVCTTDSCDPASGCEYANNNNPCDDNNACTTNDHCSGGSCQGGPAPDCDDENVCTTDTCNPVLGCVNLNNTGPCDDGDACTTNDVCGAPSACNPAESFDSITPPALPAGWTQSVIIGTPADGWSTVTTQSDSPPNSVFTNDPAVVTDKVLDSPPISILSPSAQVSFRTRFELEGSATTTVGFDGGVLEISIGGGAFQDILAAGGSFAAGGYTHAISTLFSSPIAGRQAWSGISGGGATPAWITSTVNLPAAAGGESIVLRWRVATDTSIAKTGQWIDSIVVNDPGCIHVCLPGAPVDCDDANPCTDDVCNPGGNCVSTPNTASCDDGNPCTIDDVCGGGSCSGTTITAPDEVQGLGIAADKETVSWSAVLYATSYGVVRGDVSALPVGPGGGDETCTTVLGPTFTVDPTTPAADTGLWYLVRGQNSCGNGSYGATSGGSPRTTTTCP